MNKEQSITELVISRTLRVPTKYPREIDVAQDSMYGRELIARQLDTVLMSTGFKASKELLYYIMCLEPSTAVDYTREITSAIKELIGDHVQHNVYFIDFPKNVPDTIEFWVGLIERTYGKNTDKLWNGNLLELDSYGEYQHSYEEMLEAHEKFAPKLPKRFRLLDLGEGLNEEAQKILRALVESKVPANEEDLDVIRKLTDIYLPNLIDIDIPVREHKAIVNGVRFNQGYKPDLDTTTDFLRLMVELSGGDVSLETKTKFKSVNRTSRKRLLSYLDELIARDERKLGDVFKFRERFKRLDEILHSRDYLEYEYAAKVFEVARGAGNLSINSKLEFAFNNNDYLAVYEILSDRPGILIRNFNRIAKNSRSAVDDIVLVTAIEKALENTSTKAILGFRQYLQNRQDGLTNRLFINKKGTGKVIPNNESSLGDHVLDLAIQKVDAELSKRMPKGTFIVEQGFEKVAIPISNKQTANGFDVMPRGSVDEIKSKNIRLFTYWKEKGNRTDYDLSVILLNTNFEKIGQVSYTNLKNTGIVHSGDITSAPKGASEFIDIDTSLLDSKVKYIVPQVNNYSGDSFDKVLESFFGYMALDGEEKGKPFEPLAVETKAELRGDKNVSMPIVFTREVNGWSVKWINALLEGYSWGNATENNSLTTGVLVRSFIETNFLNLEYYLDLLSNGADIHIFNPDRVEPLEVADGEKDLTFIGKNVPENLPTKTKVITLNNLVDLVQ